jgi:hypothetical protein
MLGLPPTLVQVGTAEVLVDDTLELQKLAKGVDVDVAVQAYDGVLHAWHTFFPLMPKAAHALEQAATFLCNHLDLPPPEVNPVERTYTKTTAASSAPVAIPPKADNARPSSLTANESEYEAAAVKLQAVQRGRLARETTSATQSPMLRAPTTVKWTADYDRQAELAAVKVQAMQRGRASRTSMSNAALTYGLSDLASKETLEKRQTEVLKVGYVEAGPVADNEAAVRLQARQRARKAQHEAMAVRKERDDAALKVQAARRGHTVRKQAKADLEASKTMQAHAATQLQKGMRGKMARTELRETVAERKLAATKVQAVRRGQRARRDISGVMPERAGQANGT